MIKVGRNRMLASSQSYLATTYPLITKKNKTVNLCFKKPGRHYCNQVIKVNVTCHKSHKHQVPSDMMG